MKIINFGSLNIDHVYQVPHFVRPGETLAAGSYRKGAGGKGLNQSVALARAGAEVWHAGRIGEDGLFLKTLLEKAGANCSLLEISATEATGHAMIQVSSEGENCIVLYGGANQNMPETWVARQLSHAEKGDILLLQNEIASLPFIMEEAFRRGMRIFFNPAPMTDAVFAMPLQKIDTLIVNEIEAAHLSGAKPQEDEQNILTLAAARFPQTNILMTLGSKGAVHRAVSGEIIRVPAEKVERVVDTTAAGDTFIGYYLASLMAGVPVKESLHRASRAAALCVSRAGAADSIPVEAEVVGGM